MQTNEIFFRPMQGVAQSHTLNSILFYTISELFDEKKRKSIQITTNLSKQKCIFHALEYECDYETPIRCLCTMERREKSIKTLLLTQRVFK